MKRKLVLHRETVHRLDPQDLRRAAAGVPPSLTTFPPTGVDTNTRQVPYLTSQDLSWCISCESNSYTYCYTDPGQVAF